MENNEYASEQRTIWKDRKRICGLPITFTKYSLVEKQNSYMKLFVSIGLFSTHTEEVNVYRIDDLSVSQTLFDKMFDVGTITVWCKDASDDSIILRKVKSPYKVREILAAEVEKQRNSKRFGFSEFQV
ncbi:MAG: PH domain-containing protein [Clostridia bacterium]